MFLVTASISELWAFASLLLASVCYIAGGKIASESMAIETTVSQRMRAFWDTDIPAFATLSRQVLRHDPSLYPASLCVCVLSSSVVIWLMQLA